MADLPVCEHFEWYTIKTYPCVSKQDWWIFFSCSPSSLTGVAEPSASKKKKNSLFILKWISISFQTDGFLKDNNNAAQRLLDGMNFMAQSVSELSLGPTKAVTSWLTDQIAPAYWRPNSQILVNGNCCTQNLCIAKTCFLRPLSIIAFCRFHMLSCFIVTSSSPTILGTLKWF